MIKTVRTTVYKSTCDICGKKEDVNDDCIRMFGPYHPKSWIRILLEKPFDQKIKNPDKPYYSMDLCPKCAKKLKKLIMAVEVEDEED